ncbi:MAG: hypothetical protein P4L76_16370 [Beijerinckiaceae bacterium]|nr:hypothetical protein [Beijerinckiaceae bacterium]
MSELRTIEIDFDIHKIIETERSGFHETPNEVLRRLLKLPKIPAPAVSQMTAPKGRSWSDGGVMLEHGTKLRMSYNGQTHEGEIRDGKWVVEGKTFRSPSGAASGTALTKQGKKTQLDGWKYWEVKPLGTDKWATLDSLAQKIDVTSKSATELGL